MKKYFSLLSFIVLSISISALNTAGVLTVTTTTSNPGSTSYQNKNVVAIWIENSNGALVNTMLYNTSNGNSSCQDMSAFWSKIGSSFSKIGNNITLDASTGATNIFYGNKTAIWGLKSTVATVADGVYTVKLEIASDVAPLNTAGHKLVSYTFTKGSASSTGTLVGAAQSCFTGTTVQWVPTVTALSNPALEALYKVYPNPTKSNIYVDGSDVQQVEVFNLEGKLLLKSNQQNLNLAGLVKGTYLAEITTAKGKLVKKIVKE
jgi:hypothetical protein